MASKSAKEKADRMLHNMMTNNVFVVIDLETSGFSPNKGGEILEIGACKYDFQTKTLQSFSSFIHPTRKIPEKITELTGITNNDCKDAPEMEVAVKKFYDEFVQDNVVVCHNAQFDWNTFLLPAFRKVGIQAKNDVVCTKVLSSYLLPNMGYDGKFNLKDLVTFFSGKPPAESHRAYEDALNTTALLRRLRQIVDNMEPIDLHIENKKGFPVRLSFESAMLYRVNPWKKNKIERLYISTSIATVYYDYARGIWVVSSAKNSVDLSTLVPFLEKYIKSDSPGESLPDWLENHRPT